MSEASRKIEPKVASDVELVNAIAGRDESALLELQRRHTPLVRRVVARVLGNGCTNPRTHAEDAEQETWDRVWKHARRFDETQGVVEAWLTTIAKRRALTDLVRCLKRRENEVQLEEGSTIARAGWADTYELPQVVQGLDLAERVLENLSEQHRTIVELGLYDRTPYAEVSAQLGVSIAKIKVVIYRFKQACIELDRSSSGRDEKN